MSAHTPGPWTLEGRMVLGRAFDGSEKAIVECVRGGSPDEADANATLITAAPELLEAVRAGGRYSDALQRYQENGVRGRMVPGTAELEHLFKDWHDKGHAAIDKAMGQPPSVDAVDPHAASPGTPSTRD